MPKLEGFALSRYRSFGEGLAFLVPMSAVNLLAGPNNSGKSNVLRYCQQVLGALGQGRGRRAPLPEFQGHDVASGLDGRSKFALAITKDAALSRIRETARSDLASELDGLGRVLDSDAFRLTGDALVWVTYSIESAERGRASVNMSAAQLNAAMESTDSPTRSAISRTSAALTNTQGGGPTDDLRRVVEKALDLVDLVPAVQTINALRQIQPGGDGFGGYSGEGIISGLARLQDPDAADQQDRDRFDAVNRFLQVVLDDPSARLRIPHHRRTINVDLDGLLLPIENLGMGIHEVVILAAAATLLADHLVCIEEPEIHLHPLLQRKLLHYLATQTSNQYLIATHSAHLLDATLASIFHVTTADRRTRISRAVSPKEIAGICADLGFRPSDLLQANAVIWVEGPSDRVYLRHWLRAAAPELVEGVHYAIMFYGGRLLNHLSPNDPDIEDFISLRRLNRHIAVLIDSDQSSSGTRLSATKLRVRDGFDEGPGFAWVTHGYCIENYVPPELLSQAVRTIHTRTRLNWRGERFANPLSAPNMSEAPKFVDKVAISRAVVGFWDRDQKARYDLEAQVSRLVRFVRKANGIDRESDGPPNVTSGP